MPNYPPDLVDLSAPRLVHWLSPRRMTEVGPTWIGHRITLSHQPFVWYPAYQWADNTFRATRARLPDVADIETAGYTPYAPIVLTVGGQTALDKTDYRSHEAPPLSDYTVTRRIEYYLDGRSLVTNATFATVALSLTGVVVTYTSVSTRVQIVARMRTNTTSQSTTAPNIDAYTVQLRPGLHPHQSR